MPGNGPDHRPVPICAQQGLAVLRQPGGVTGTTTKSGALAQTLRRHPTRPRGVATSVRAHPSPIANPSAPWPTHAPRYGDLPATFWQFICLAAIFPC